MSEKIKGKSDKQFYEYFFHEARFPIVEKALSPKNAQKFRESSKNNNNFHPISHQELLRPLK